jgi:hypothetical protein
MSTQCSSFVTVLPFTLTAHQHEAFTHDVRLNELGI